MIWFAGSPSLDGTRIREPGGAFAIKGFSSMDDGNGKNGFELAVFSTT